MLCCDCRLDLCKQCQAGCKGTRLWADARHQKRWIQRKHLHTLTKPQNWPDREPEQANSWKGYVEEGHGKVQNAHDALAVQQLRIRCRGCGMKDMVISTLQIPEVSC